jgi:hypothetical protein
MHWSDVVMKLGKYQIVDLEEQIEEKLAPPQWKLLAVSDSATQLKPTSAGGETNNKQSQGQLPDN